MPRLLLALPLFLLGLPGQSAAPGDDLLRPAVWALLDARSPAARASARAAWDRLPGVSLDRVLRILDAPRELPPAAPGSRPREPFTIPGTEVETSYALWIPQGYDPAKPCPLWIASHATGGRAPGTLQGALRALRGKGVIIAAPQETGARRGRGWGGSAPERDLHLGLIDHLARRYAIDRDRVVITGWSRGGHCAWDLAVRRPDRFCGTGPVVGGPRLQDFGLLGNLRGLRLHALNGAHDDPRLVATVREAKRRLEAEGVDAVVEIDPEAGHESMYHRMPAMVERLLPARRSVHPRKLTFATFDPAFDRRGYVHITRFARTAYRPGKRIAIPGISKMSEKGRRRAYREYVEKHTAAVEVSCQQNRFTITTRHVAALDLYVPLALVDLDEPIMVRVNGRSRIRKRRLEPPTPLRLLELMREFAGPDPAFRFVTRLSFKIRS